MSHNKDQDRIHQLLQRLDRVRLESEDIRARVEQIRGINVEPVRISHDTGRFAHRTDESRNRDPRE
jgi:hypothetical protein